MFARPVLRRCLFLAPAFHFAVEPGKNPMNAAPGAAPTAEPTHEHPPSPRPLPVLERAARPTGASEPRGRIALQGLTPDELTAHVPGLLLAEARRIVAAVHRGEDISQPRNGVRRSARAAVQELGHVPTLDVLASTQSTVDSFVKLLFRTADDRRIEAVRIPLERPGRFSVCVSSQVGCALACAFCATGRLGLARNLETWEIVEQVRLMRATLDRARGQRVHGLVFQGMGEPLANLERVFAAVRVLTDPNAIGIDARRITISTAGLPAGMRRMARELPKVRLAWSIGSALPAQRASLMPIDRAHPLEECYDACVEHARLTHLAPLWAVTLLEGVNDTPEHALALAALAQRFAEDTGRRPRISIIPYNRIDEEADPFRRVDEDADARFRDVMRAAGAPTHRRYSGGSDVAAACGQLAATPDGSARPPTRARPARAPGPSAG
jgi:23S rRNA (adenine2503-C2)-methyltransferase